MFGFCSRHGSSSDTRNNSCSCRTLGSLACFGKMDGDSFGFIIMPDLFIACLCSSCRARCGPVRMLEGEALMKHSCVPGVFSEESVACLREGQSV